jgi:hypothetical protein
VIVSLHSSRLLSFISFFLSPHLYPPFFLRCSSPSSFPSSLTYSLPSSHLLLNLSPTLPIFHACSFLLYLPVTLPFSLVFSLPLSPICRMCVSCEPDLITPMIETSCANLLEIKQLRPFTKVDIHELSKILNIIFLY